MLQLLIERAWAWLHATFPERQIYIRSEGRIQFFTFSSTLQATCTGLCLIFLGWIAFASVNVVFKDRIIAAKDHRYRQMQGAYENRVADLQLSYDELNDALLSAEDRFKSTVDELATKQRTIAGLIRGKPNATMSSLLGTARNTDADWSGSAEYAGAANDLGVAGDSLGTDANPPPRSPRYPVPSLPSSTAHGSGSSQLGIMPEPVEPQPRTARPSQASMLDDTLLRLVGALFRVTATPSPVYDAVSPEVSRLGHQTFRAMQISKSETGLLAAFDRSLTDQITVAEAVLASLGVSRTALQQPATEAGVGGPLVPLRVVRMNGISDPAFVSAYSEATARETQLHALTSALTRIPLAMPVRGSQFKLSSGFGPRIDPFTGRVAFHSGVDLAGPWGSAVYATAPGVVVWAGFRGGYGNMVEVDHGYGFQTRYGHLSSIVVRQGANVQEGTLLGRLGSTGRSTGPHVHYEVWLADSARNPDRYLEMGRRLLE